MSISTYIYIYESISILCGIERGVHDLQMMADFPYANFGQKGIPLSMWLVAGV